MPITSLESYLNENKLLLSTPLESFQHSIIGIDVVHYLDTIFARQNEPLFLAVGGFFSGVKNTIKADLKVFEEFNILPLFVFSGMSIDCTFERFKGKELSLRETHVEAAWNRLDARPTDSQISFHRTTDDLSSLVVEDLIDLFISNGLDYFVCPYNASFQLSYLQEKRIIDAAYGSTDLIITRLDMFILGIDFQTKEVKLIDKAKFLTEINLSERQLIDLSIMVGCCVQPSIFPHLPQSNGTLLAHLPSATFRAALESVHHYLSFSAVGSNNLLGYVYGLHDQALVDLYLRGIAACEFMPILTNDGLIAMHVTETSKLKSSGKETYLLLNPLNQAQSSSENLEVTTFAIPNDIHTVISQRLPPEIFFYNSIGLLPTNILDGITTGHLYIRPPLQGTSCYQYQKMIISEKSRQILDFKFNLLTQLLARYYQVKKIEVHYWFNDRVFQSNMRLNPSVASRLNDLKTIECKEQNFSFVGFWKKDVTEGPVNDSRSGVSKGALIANSFWRSLFITGLIEQNSSESIVVKIFKSFAKQNTNVSDEVMEHLFLLLCLVHEKGADVLFEKDTILSVPEEIKGKELAVNLTTEQRQCICAISRVCSLVTLAHEPSPYHGAVSRSLMSFRSCMGVIRERLLSSLKLSLVDLIARRDNIKSQMNNKADWIELMKSIPFKTSQANTLMGILSEVFFEYALKKHNSGVSLSQASLEASSHLRSILSDKRTQNEEQYLMNCILIDFDKAIKFWNSFNSLMKLAHEHDSKFVSPTHIAVMLKANKIIEELAPKN